MNLNAINFLILLKNASNCFKETIVVSYTAQRVALLSSLYQEGYIQSFKIEGSLRIIIFLRYSNNKSVLQNLKVLSTPSSTRYITLKELSRVPDKRFTLFISTSKGLLTSFNCKKQGLGGKLLFIC